MNTKRILLIALCCVLGGIVLMTTCVGIAYASGADLSDRWHRERNESRTYENTGTQRREEDKVRTIELGLIGEPLTIRRGGDRVVIEWSQEYDEQYDYTINSAGDLLLERREVVDSGFGVFYDQRGFHVNFDTFMDLADRLFRWDWRTGVTANGDSGSTRPVTITIPEGVTLESLDIGTVSGDVTLEDLDADSIGFAGVDADIRLDRCRADRLDIGNVDGRAELMDCEMSDVDMGTVSGRMDLRGGRCKTIGIGGVDARLEIDGTEALRDVEISGINAEAYLRLPGTADDYDLSADGMNGELIINGRFAGRSRSGRDAEAEISAGGMNAILRIDFADN